MENQLFETRLPQTSKMAVKMDVHSFVKKQQELLRLEREAEIEESKVCKKTWSIKDIENKGLCLSKLHVVGQCTGLYGKQLITFSPVRKRPKTSEKSESLNSKPAKEIHFTNGDIVGLQLSSAELNEEYLSSGVVTKARDDVITVAFDVVKVVPDDLYRLIKLCNDVTYKRMKEALHSLDSNEPSHLKDILFHSTKIGPKLSLLNNENFAPFNERLNTSQLDAVQFALNQKDIAIIHGPPGTGKTTTIIEIIKQAVKRFGFKVLACAPSNVAVDNLVAKLADDKIKIIRLGHPARVYEHLQKHSLDAVLMNSESAEVIQGVRSDIQDTLAKLKRSNNDGEARKYKNELKFLKKELCERENKAVKSVLSNADVILSTLTSASIEGPLKHLKDRKFDLLIIDEAAQAMEASCWIPLSMTNKCILAGDHQQLPPTIISKEAARKGLEITLMERIVKEFDDNVVHMLTTQYRMHYDIMTWPSQQLYDGKLVADQMVINHLLPDLPGVCSDEATSIPLLFIDTAGCCMHELPHELEESKGNEHEVGLVECHVDHLVAAGVKQQDIGIITPYNLQVELLRQSLSSKYREIEIKSVDGFQGREKEAIIISLVRSNTKGEVGFLKEDRRLNVAITRARRHLAVVGDSNTISQHAFLKSFVDYVTEFGEVRSAENYSQKNKQTVDVSSIDSTETILKNFEELKHMKDDMKVAEKLKPGSRNSLDSSKQKSQANNTNAITPSKMNLFDQTENCSGLTSEHDENTSRAEATSHQDAVIIKKRKPASFSKQELENKITEFMSADDEKELNFDTTLDSRARFYVHEIAERFGLLHRSAGIGNDRYICIRKVSWKDTLPERGKNDIGGNLLTAASDTCTSCGKQMPKQNLHLHSLKCAKGLELGKREIETKKRKEKEKVKSRKSGKQERSDKTEAIGSNDDDNFDKVLAEFTKMDSKCNHDKCSASVVVLSQHCKFCGRTFCLKHGLAEVHGCGEAAKIDAKQKAKNHYDKQTVKKTNELQKNHMRRKLDKKISEMENARTKQKEKR